MKKYKIYLQIELLISSILIGNWSANICLNTSSKLSILLGIVGIISLIANIARRFNLYVVNGER
jgi:hypothetical protein